MTHEIFGPHSMRTKREVANINAHLIRGGRGLPGGITLAKLLERERGVNNLKNRPRLTLGRILDWADEHFERTGSWPIQREGPDTESPTETWRGIDAALRAGGRGLLGGASLAALLTRKRGVVIGAESSFRSVLPLVSRSVGSGASYRGISGVVSCYDSYDERVANAGRILVSAPLSENEDRFPCYVSCATYEAPKGA